MTTNNDRTNHNDRTSHNDSIGCDVTECSYHCTQDNYCTLNKIQVTKHTNDATTTESTDCGSFKRDTQY